MIRNFKKTADFMLINEPYSFVFTDHNQEIIIELLKYFTGFQSKYDSHKSIHMAGERGRGKTLLMYIFQRFLTFYYMNNKPKNPPYFKITRAVQVGLSYQNEKKGVVIFDEFKQNYCIDDILREEDFYVSYGKKNNVIRTIIDQSYELWKNKGVKLHTTTNGNPDKLELKYETRTAECLLEMSNQIVLLGENFRKK